MNQELKKYMQLRKLSISDLSHASGVKRAYVSHLVHGERKNPSNKIVTKLARALEVTPAQLFPSLYE
jgi:transcriptional regulator with XRE-family HTH domain